MGTKIILVLVVIGLILGLALIRSELVNPFTGMAVYERARVETQTLAQRNDIDMQVYAARRELESKHLPQLMSIEFQQQAKENRHQEEISALEKQMLEDKINHQQQLQEKELQRIQARAEFEQIMLENAGKVLPWTAGLAAIFLSIGLVYLIARPIVAALEASPVLVRLLALALAGSAFATIVLVLDYLVA